MSCRRGHYSPLAPAPLAWRMRGLREHGDETYRSSPPCRRTSPCTCSPVCSSSPGTPFPSSPSLRPCLHGGHTRRSGTLRDHGWVLIDGLIGTDEIDAALDDVYRAFPTAEQYHADPEGETERRLGRPPPHTGFVWPDEGPGFRDDQHRWRADFPFAGTGALNRLVVHPNLVDFVERALATTDPRIYQTGISAKYTGITNYEQPMHTDRNHSWLPAVPEAPWWHVEGFLYLSDVSARGNPTHLVSVRDSVGRPTTTPLIMPDRDPEIYAREQGAAGVRGSFLAYRPDVFHRAVELSEPGGSASC